MNSSKIMCKTVSLILVILLLYVFINNVDNCNAQYFEDMGRGKLSQLLVERLRDKGLDYPVNSPEEIAVLPGYPNSVLEVYRLPGYSDPPIYALRSIKVYGKTIASYRQQTSRMSLGEAISRAIGDYRNYALDLFYTQIQLLSVGTPPGFYDTIKPSGLKTLHIPEPGLVRGVIKPEILLIVVGLTDGMNIDKPLYIYYIGFETTGYTFDNIPVKVTVVASVVIDEQKAIYEDLMGIMGLCFYYYVGAETPVTIAWPATTVYGFIGILASLFVFFITIDETGKYYMVTFLLFILQIILYILVNVLAGIEPGRVHLSALNTGSWLIVIFVLWIPAYIIATYKYYTASEVEPTTSVVAALVEGVSLAVFVTLLATMSIFYERVVGGAIALGGLGGFIMLITFLSFVDLAVGYLLGKLWANMRRIGGLYSY